MCLDCGRKPEKHMQEKKREDMQTPAGLYHRKNGMIYEWEHGRSFLNEVLRSCGETGSGPNHWEAYELDFF